MSTTRVATRPLSNVVNAGEADSRRWLILATICFAALMIVLDVTVMNLALPSAQRALGFTNADRQWIVTAYSLSFGSLLPPLGRP
jgi:MFS family permease